MRPKTMTEVAIIAALLPIMWGSGTGSDVMRRIAAPMVGGMVSATVLTLVIIPSLYLLLNGWRLPDESALSEGYNFQRSSQDSERLQDRRRPTGADCDHGGE